jgi:O-antigen/teichoic acid export membrane protein
LQSSTTSAGGGSRSLFKNMLQGSGVYMLGIIGQRVASLVLVPVVTRYLVPADYGVLDLMEQIGVIMSVILGLNFASALGYFYFAPGADRSRVVSTTLWGSFLIGVVGSVVGWFAAGPLSQRFLHSQEFVPYLRLIFAIMPLSFLLEAGMSWLRVENLPSWFTGLSLLRVVLTVGGTITLVAGFGLRVGGVLGSNVFAAAVVAIVVGIIGLRHHGSHFDLAIFKKMARFAFPLTISAVALFAIHFGDRLILPSYRAFDELGVYTLAYKMGMILAPIQAAFESYWTAQMYQIVARSDAKLVFGRAFTYLTLVMSSGALGVLVFSHPALLLMTSPAYYRAESLIPIILLAYYVRALGDFFRNVLLARGLPGHDAACNWTAAAVSLVAYLTLIPRYGIQGAAIATLITFAVSGVVARLLSNRVWTCELELRRLTKIVVSSGLMAAGHLMLPRASIPIEIARGAILMISFGGLLLGSGFLTPGEKLIVQNGFARVKALLGTKPGAADAEH